MYTQDPLTTAHHTYSSLLFLSSKKAFWSISLVRAVASVLSISVEDSGSPSPGGLVR